MHMVPSSPAGLSHTPAAPSPYDESPSPMPYYMDSPYPPAFQQMVMYPQLYAQRMVMAPAMGTPMGMVAPAMGRAMAMMAVPNAPGMMDTMYMQTVPPEYVYEEFTPTQAVMTAGGTTVQTPVPVAQVGVAMGAPAGPQSAFTSYSTLPETEMHDLSHSMSRSLNLSSASASTQDEGLYAMQVPAQLPQMMSAPNAGGAVQRGTQAPLMVPYYLSIPSTDEASVATTATMQQQQHQPRHREHAQLGQQQGRAGGTNRYAEFLDLVNTAYPQWVSAY